MVAGSNSVFNTNLLCPLCSLRVVDPLFSPADETKKLGYNVVQVCVWSKNPWKCVLWRLQQHGESSRLGTVTVTDRIHLGN